MLFALLVWRHLIDLERFLFFSAKAKREEKVTHMGECKRQSCEPFDLRASLF